MEWIELYKPDRKPSEKDIADFIDNPLWSELKAFLEKNYLVEPIMSYSTCSGQPGWNVKYQKSGRSLCTLYPMPGFFIALVVIGNKEYEKTLELMPECTEYVRDLFDKTPYSAMGRWLMIHVENKDVLNDVERLIQVRRKIPAAS